VREGQQPNYVLPLQVNDLIRKSIDWELSGRNVLRDAHNTSADLRPASDLLQGTIDGLDKLNAQACSLGVVPDRRVL